MSSNHLDHLVVNTHFEIDAAQALFAGLGFTLTPRGYHSLGSINHLVVFARGYLELIGLSPGGKIRQEILDSPVGVDGLVFNSPDAEASYANLAQAGFKLQPVQHFSRPVEVEGQEHLARFSTVRLLPGQLPGGRVYFCRHHTPELIWRTEWTRHDNGVQDIAGLVVVGANREQLGRDYARLGQPDENFALTFLDRDGFDRHYGLLAVHAPLRADFFGAIRLRTDRLDVVATNASNLGLPLERGAARVVVALPRFQTLLEFIG
jgi:hypothetical protein